MHKLVKPEDINKLLKNYLDTIDSIKAAVIVDNVGLVVASTLKSDLEDLKRSALTAHLQNLTERIVQEADSGYFKNLTLELEEQKFIFSEAGSSNLLLTVIDKYASADEVIPYAKIVGEKVSKILSGEKISLEIKKIPKVPLTAKKAKPKKRLIYKIVVVGEPNVGKTTLLVRFATGRFESTYKPTLGVDIIKHTYRYDSGVEITFTAWDISGQTSFKSLRRTYYPNTEIFLIVYDVTNLESFNSIEYWLEEVQQYGMKESIFILVGNKIDLKKEIVISNEKGQSRAKELELEFFETSAKTGDNVNTLFFHLGKRIIEKRKIKS